MLTTTGLASKGGSHAMNDPREHDQETGLSRRQFLQTSGAVAVLSAAPLAETPAAGEGGAAPAGIGPGAAALTLNVNGNRLTTRVEPRVTLLDALRNYLDVTGCKRVCDR